MALTDSVSDGLHPTVRKVINAWPLILALGTIFVAGVQANTQLQEHSRRLDTLEAQSQPFAEKLTRIEQQGKDTLERLDRIERRQDEERGGK
jgi:hypothetical protein